MAFGKQHHFSHLLTASVAFALTGDEQRTKAKATVDEVSLLRREPHSHVTSFLNAYAEDVTGVMSAITRNSNERTAKRVGSGLRALMSLSQEDDEQHHARHRALSANAALYWRRTLWAWASYSSPDPGFKARIAPKLEAMKERRHSIPNISAAMMGSSLKVDEASPGTYNACHRSSPIFWLQMWGHARSLGMHVKNLRSFLDGSSTCWFATVYARREIDHEHDPSTPWVPDQTAQLEELSKRGVTAALLLNDVGEQLGSNFAWVTVSRSIEKHHIWDLIPGAVIFGRAVAQEHSIPTSPNDIVALSRPDIVFSHALRFSSLTAAASRTPYVLMPHHEADEFGRDDPSEMLVISLRSFWEGACMSHFQAGAQKGGSSELVMGGDTCTHCADLERLGTGCMEHRSGCGFFARLFIYGAAAMGFQPFFYNTDIKLHIHRVNGDFSLGVMRPLEDDGLTDPNAEVVGVADLTKNATCAVGRVDACKRTQRSAAASGPRSGWGQTSWTKVSGTTGFWRCVKNSDIA